MQNRDIDKLEERVNSVNTEANSLRTDNEVLRMENVSLRSEISHADRDVSLHKEKLYKCKRQVQLLKHSLAEADDKLRELIYQKHNEIRQNSYPHDDDQVNSLIHSIYIISLCFLV